MSDCLFCRIARKEIPSKTVYEDEHVYAFYDISPQAPVHILIIPKKHIASVNDLDESQAGIMDRLFITAKKIAKDNNIDETGYRTVFNTNADAGMAVAHLHLHLLGGRKLSWPPG